MRLSTAFIIPLISLSASALANDYPTDARAFYVVHCMHDLGEQNLEHLYTCSCRIDSIAKQLVYVDYEFATTYERNKTAYGENGGVFRDNIPAKEMFSKLTEARKTAEQECPVVKKVINPREEEPVDEEKYREEE
ncbi:MAG: hypothetical protein A2W28_01870 [Gammaproteobacteria bacterium RBG_16_51_14]|nr:MAG: hypothetical protein A2W28_01870 [Gammaproteobacteria bacterium RBG_16_51_14]